MFSSIAKLTGEVATVALCYEPRELSFKLVSGE